MTVWRKFYWHLAFDTWTPTNYKEATSNTHSSTKSYFMAMELNAQIRLLVAERLEVVCFLRSNVFFSLSARFRLDLAKTMNFTIFELCFFLLTLKYLRSSIITLLASHSNTFTYHFHKRIIQICTETHTQSMQTVFNYCRCEMILEKLWKYRISGRQKVLSLDFLFFFLRRFFIDWVAFNEHTFSAWYQMIDWIRMSEVEIKWELSLVAFCPTQFHLSHNQSG